MKKKYIETGNFTFSVRFVPTPYPQNKLSLMVIGIDIFDMFVQNNFIHGTNVKSFSKIIPRMVRNVYRTESKLNN